MPNCGISFSSSELSQPVMQRTHADPENLSGFGFVVVRLLQNPVDVSFFNFFHRRAGTEPDRLAVLDRRFRGEVSRMLNALVGRGYGRNRSPLIRAWRTGNL